MSEWVKSFIAGAVFGIVLHIAGSPVIEHPVRFIILTVVLSLVRTELRPVTP